MPTTDILVLHTTETSGWPGYDGGADAPTMTVRVDTAGRRLAVRQHFPLDMSARALVHPAGTAATNTAGVIQIELVGTCDPTLKKAMFFWPEAPRWALDELAKVVATLHTIRSIPLKACSPWLAFPASFGSHTSARMSWAEWKAFAGVCGHQHVPGNDHGDPGHLDIEHVINKAAATAAEGEDDMSAADVAAIKAHLDSKVDDIAALAATRVWGFALAQAWDGQKAPAGEMLSSAQRYAIEAGFPGVRPPGSSSPGTPTSSKLLRAALDAKAQKDDVDALSMKLDTIIAALEKLESTQ
jgi:hypothetical protein